MDDNQDATAEMTLASLRQKIEGMKLPPVDEEDFRYRAEDELESEIAKTEGWNAALDGVIALL